MVVYRKGLPHRQIEMNERIHLIQFSLPTKSRQRLPRKMVNIIFSCLLFPFIDFQWCKLAFGTANCLFKVGEDFRCSL